MRRRRRGRPCLLFFVGLAVLGGWIAPDRARAEEPALPDGTDGEQGPASLDATEFTIGAGGILNTGNSRSLAATGTSDLRIRRTIHQFSANLAGNYGKSATAKNGPWIDTSRNVQGRVRYDLFFAERWSAFLMATVRNDTFQGVEYRLNLDPGVAFYAIPGKDHRLWFEAGYDFQYEIRTDAAILAHDDAGNLVLTGGTTTRVLDKTDINHAARLYAGYVNNVDQRVNFLTGFEYLQSFLAGERFRMNFDLGLSTQLKERLSLAITFTLRYDHSPLPEVETLDTITSLQLTYRFF